MWAVFDNWQASADDIDVAHRMTCVNGFLNTPSKIRGLQNERLMYMFDVQAFPEYVISIKLNSQA